MFFVTLVLNELLSWTRSQSGTASLRAIFYMDEIFGYFPPVANPPSKRPLLTLLKQARAFGVGLVLATQNPVDLDYKGLANTGTWFIGRLQTERDKQRLMEGLEGALSETGAPFDRAATERMLSGLGKRVFLMNNVHESGPVAFESRWALSWLRGPLTRTQIRTLTQGRKPVSGPSRPQANVSAAQGSTRPAVPPDVPQSFIPIRGKHEKIVYQPMILGCAQIRFADTKTKADLSRTSVFLTPIQDDAVPVEWEQSFEVKIDPNNLSREPEAGAEFATLPPAAVNAKAYAQWSRDFVAWLAGSQTLEIFTSPQTKLSSEPGETEGEFRVRLQQAVREARDAEVQKLRSKYESKFNALEERIRKAEQAVAREREQAQSQTLNTALEVGAGVFGALFGRRRIATAATSGMRSASRAYRQSGDVGRAEETVRSLTEQLHELESHVNEEVQTVQNGLDAANVPLKVASIKPKKTDIQVRLLSLAWAPQAVDSQGRSAAAWE
jgi:hypothetical protein